jgi:monoamine oxidase
LLAQGELVRDGVIPDLSINNALAGLRQFPYYEAALALQLIQDGADPKLASVLDTYNFASHSAAPFVYPVDDTFFLRYGMGNFIQRLAKGLHVITNSPVAGIDYNGTGPVTVRLVNKTAYHARKVIVTVSTGVLAATKGNGIIAFSPTLPKGYTNALAALPMGNAYKAALTFKSNIFKGRQGIAGNEMKSLVDLVDHPGQGVFVNYFGKPMAVFIGDAKTGDGYESMSDAQAATFFLNILETYFPGAKAAWTGKIATTKWRTNPYTRGATSYATTKHTAARTYLATPIEQKIWFAGEALSLAAHSQLHGAWQSGQSAGYGTLASLGVAVRAPG